MVGTDEYLLATGLDNRLSEREDARPECQWGLQQIKQIKVLHNLYYGTRKAEINSLRTTRKSPRLGKSNTQDIGNKENLKTKYKSE